MKHKQQNQYKQQKPLHRTTEQRTHPHMTNDKHTIKEQDQEQRKTNSRNKQHKIKEQKTNTSRTKENKKTIKDQTTHQ